MILRIETKDKYYFNRCFTRRRERLKDEQKYYRSYDLVEARKYGFSREPARHQELALKNLFNWYDENKDHSKPAGEILVLPTGSGKTFVAIRFLCLKPLSDGYKILWLAHTHHLLDQGFKEFDKHLNKIAEIKKSLKVRVVSGCKGHFRINAIKPDDDVLIATLQSVSQANDDRHPALEAFLESSGGKLFVVFDEAHHAPAPSYRRLISELREQYKEMYLLGLTATPIYSDERYAGWLTKLFPQGFPKIVTAQDLMAQGILSQPISEQAETRITPDFEEREYQKWIGTFRDLPEDIITQLAKNRERNLYIAKYYADNREKYGKTLIFADRWYQCEAISDFLNQHGIRTGTIYSHADANSEFVGERKRRTADENSRAFDAFRKGELDVVINVRMLTEGTDVPDVKTVFITRQTTSQILLTQMVGRALRGPKFGGTDKAYLVFFIDDWKKLINWAEYEPISPLVEADEEIEYGKRPPLQYISIELVRKLDEMMFQGISINPIPFRSLLPIGWYRVEYVAQQANVNQLICEREDNEADIEISDGNDAETDVEQIRRLVMVFEHEMENYEKFIDFLITRPPKKFEDERVQFKDSKSSVCAWRNTFFPDVEEHFGSDLLQDVFSMARHIAQNEEKPKFFKFGDRDQYDLDVIAKDHIGRDLGPKQINEELKREYSREDRYWNVFYQNYEQFKNHYDKCVNRLLMQSNDSEIQNHALIERDDIRPVEAVNNSGLVVEYEEDNNTIRDSIEPSPDTISKSNIEPPDDIITSMQILGLNRNVAAVLAYLLNKKEALSREVEIAADLRQPEVSIAMQYLREMGWIDEKEIRHDGKGRPSKIFVIDIEKADIITFFENRKRQEFALAIENIQKLIGSIKTKDISSTEFVTSLQNLGANRIVANVLAYMSYSNNKKDISFREIELATGLRQPEVSLGVQFLREKGWINERETKGEGKGRPTKTICLSMDIEEIIKLLEEDKRRDFAFATENIQNLRKKFAS